MGATGTGKSTVCTFLLDCALCTNRAHPITTPGPPWFEQFINLASGSEFVVSDSQQSCTAKVEATEAFDVGQHRVILIDTPGFNDTNLTDKQVLQLIVTYLEASYVKFSFPPKKLRLNLYADTEGASSSLVFSTSTISPLSG